MIVIKEKKQTFNNTNTNKSKITNIVNLKCPTKPNNSCIKKNKQKKIVFKKAFMLKPKIMTEKICGLIFQLCDSNEITYFKTIGVNSSIGILKLQNNSDSSMSVRIETYSVGKNKWIEEVVNAYQQINLAIKSIQSISVKFNGKSSEAYCKGKFSLCLS